MSMNRRDFIKGVGGLCAAITGISATSGLVRTSETWSSGVAEASSSGSVKSAVRWGMVIDTTKFNSEQDFQLCQKACHSLHNVPKFESLKDEIKWIWSVKYHEAFPSTANPLTSEEVEKRRYLVLCNHCEKPPCVRVCPTKATFKSSDGITQMDMHRCIGCRFCMAACPYGARSFNWRNPRIDDKTLVGDIKINQEYPTRERGVVEKCTFCTEQIAKGPVPAAGQELTDAQKPACVRAFPHGLIFGNLNDPNSEIRRTLRERATFQRKPELGTNPSVYYIL